MNITSPFFIRRLAIVTTFALAVACGFSQAPVVGQTTTRVLANQPVGKLKGDLAGVSLGGGATTYVNTAHLQSLDGLGVRYVRLETITADSRGLFDAATGRWDWSKLDQEIENIRVTGAEIVANVFYTPRSLAFHDDKTYFYSYPKDYTAWKSYVSEIVRHVNREKGYGIKYWEIGNEPSARHFFRAPMTEFFAYYAATAQAIKEIDPTAQVGGFGDNAQYPENYLGWLEYCQRTGTPVDFATFHWYGQWTLKGNTEPNLLQHFSLSIEGLIREKLGRSLPILLTEWNLVGENPDPITAKVGAYLAAGFYWLQESPVEIALYFRVEPHRKTLGSLLDSGGERRTLGRIFSWFSGMPSKRVNLISVYPGVTGLASRDVDSIHVLLSRYDLRGGDSQVENKIVVSGHDLRGPHRVSLYIEDAQSADQLGQPAPRWSETRELDPASPITVDTTLGAFSVAYLKIEKATAEAVSAPLTDPRPSIRTGFSDSFSLKNGRAAGARLSGPAEQGQGAWKSFGGQPAVLGDQGGVIATGGIGSAEARLPVVLPAKEGGRFRLTARIVLGNAKEWIGIAFIDGMDGDWWSAGKPLWIFVRSDGRLSVAGNVATSNPANPAPTYSIASIPGFSKTAPVELSVVYDPATDGVDIYVNGVNTTKGWGLKTKTPLAATAAGFYINGSQAAAAGTPVSRVTAFSLTGENP